MTHWSILVSALAMCALACAPEVHLPKRTGSPVPLDEARLEARHIGGGMWVYSSVGWTEDERLHLDSTLDRHAGHMSRLSWDWIFESMTEELLTEQEWRTHHPKRFK